MDPISRISHTLSPFHLSPSLPRLQNFSIGCLGYGSIWQCNGNRRCRCHKTVKISSNVAAVAEVAEAKLPDDTTPPPTPSHTPPPATLVMLSLTFSLLVAIVIASGTRRHQPSPHCATTLEARTKVATFLIATHKLIEF